MAAACITRPVPRTPGLLGPSIPIPATLCPPRKREVIPLPSETALMSIYPVGRQGGTGGARLPPSTPSQGSAGSEPGPDGDGSE